jgi:hypothetical protein
MLETRDVSAEDVVAEHPFHATSKHRTLFDRRAIYDLAWPSDRPAKRSVPVGVEIVLDAFVFRLFHESHGTYHSPMHFFGVVDILGALWDVDRNEVIGSN